VADGDVVGAEQDLAHDEPHDLLALLDGELSGVGGQSGAEAVERFGELEAGSRRREARRRARLVQR
jgi:hypothetical protein